MIVQTNKSTDDRPKNLNHSANDYISSEGVRFCQPLYIDPPSHVRKEVYNVVRSLCETSTDVTQTPTASGITVETSCSNQHAVEAFLGCSLEMLRSHIFVRGGMQLNLWLKLQTLTSIEAFTQKDFTAAFKARAATVKAFTEKLQSPL